MIKLKMFLLILLLLAPLVLESNSPVILSEITQARTMDIAHGYLYVSEKSGISIYDLKAFKLKTRIGKKGEGPGEFKMSPQIAKMPNGIMLYGFQKIAFYTPEGVFKSEKMLDNYLSNIQYISTGYVAERSNYDRKSRTRVGEICLFDRDLNFKKLVFTGPAEKMPEPGKRHKIEYIRHCFMHQVYKEQIYIADTRKGFYFEVFDKLGNQLYVINNKYKKIPVSQKLKDQILKDRSPKMKERFQFVFPKNHPAFSFFRVAADRITVYNPFLENTKDIRKVIDLKGNKLELPENKKKRIKGISRIYQDKRYTLRENDDEDWELHIEAVEKIDK